MQGLLILGQVILALYFVTAGLNHFMKMEMLSDYAKQRGLPAAKPLTVLSGILLLLAGLGLLFGFYILWSLWALIIFLLTTAFSMHRFWTDTDPEIKMNQMINFRAAIAMAAALLMLTAFVSSWPWGLGL